MAQKFDTMPVLEVFGCGPVFGSKTPLHPKNLLTGQDHMHFMLGPCGRYIAQILSFWPVNFVSKKYSTSVDFSRM